MSYFNLELMTQATGVYPLWLVPAILDETGEDDPVFVDLGVYGWCHRYGYYLQFRFQKLNIMFFMVVVKEEIGGEFGNCTEIWGI